MQKLKFNINGKHYEATVAETSHNVAESVAVPHIAAPKPAAAAPVAAPAAAPKAAAGANSVTAPLPGSVTVVNVKAGDAVKAGQTLIIIEAMKMENEVLAPADGTVTAVHVSGGQAVQQGDALLDLA